MSEPIRELDALFRKGETRLMVTVSAVIIGAATDLLIADGNVGEVYNYFEISFVAVPWSPGMVVAGLVFLPVYLSLFADLRRSTSENKEETDDR